MARIARIVIPGVPHLIFQQGRDQKPVFLGPEDYQLYMDLLAKSCTVNQVQIWAYCLLPNRVHLIAVPDKAASLGRAIGEAHRQFSAKMNRRTGNTGNVWHGRFASAAVDDHYLSTALRYVMAQPVVQGLHRSPFAYPYSSAKAYVRGKNDLLVDTLPLSKLIHDWRTFLTSEIPPQDLKRLRLHQSTGKPLMKKTALYCHEEAAAYETKSQKAIQGEKRKTRLENPLKISLVHA